ASWVVETLAEHGIDVKIGDDQIFFELLPASDNGAAGVQNHAVAIKDKFVLAAHEIVINDDNRVVPGARRQHMLAPPTVTGMIGRGRDVDQHFSAAGQRLMKKWSIRIPDVFANADSDRHVSESEDRRFSAGLEVPEFIEDAVVGKVHLVVNGEHFPALQD